jgi:hypothetical protein
MGAIFDNGDPVSLSDRVDLIDVADEAESVLSDDGSRP